MHFIAPDSGGQKSWELGVSGVLTPLKAAFEALVHVKKDADEQRLVCLDC